MDSVPRVKARILQTPFGFRVALALCVIVSAIQGNVLDASEEQQIVSKGPVSLEEALSVDLGIPIPNSASEIEYDLKVGGLQQMALFLRFHVKPEEADHAIQSIIDNNNRMMNRSLPFPITHLPIPRAQSNKNNTHQSPNERDPTLPLWWKAPEITSGYIRAELASYAPSIFYDKEHSVVYVQMVD